MTPRFLFRSATCGGLLAVALMASAGAAPFSPAYIDLVDYPTYYAQGHAFHDLQRRLKHNFDESCPDTICEGEYTDYQALKLLCAVEAASGTVSECRWAFAASELEVDPDGGRVVAQQPRWLCRLPIPAGTTVAGLFSALEGPRPLWHQFPGGGQPIFEAVSECVAGPGTR